MSKKRLLFWGLFLVLFTFWWFSIPTPLFPENYSQVVFTKEGKLLGAQIAKDEQWRFPASDSVPFKFKKCLLMFEDEYFYYHPGVNPVALGRAMFRNIRENAITSGASTLSMQTIRLSSFQPKRTYWEKIKEMAKATRLEMAYSKDSILSMYASHTPFGGNVVGLDAASWRYFGKLPHQLSWGESATLAVLPNAPSLIFPGKNENSLRKKRNTLLEKLHHKGIISKEDLDLAEVEPLPSKPYGLPQLASHFVHLSEKKFPHSRLKSTISFELQEKVNAIVKNHYTNLRQREIQNIAVIVSEIKTGKVLAYVGNTMDPEYGHQNAVDINQAVRSSGSILKPILFASMLDKGELLPKMLLRDVPIDITENFSKMYYGRIAADEALCQSLNVPAIGLLKSHGVSNFHAELKALGFRSIQKPSSYYGLSLIVGGAEISPWDLNLAYRNLAAKLISEKLPFYTELQINENEKPQEIKQPHYSQAAIYETFTILRNVVRPENENGWRLTGSKGIAWKTGTSHGFKDAWSVGISSNYVVSVWVGNADGEGRPGIIGVESAAPILFDVFKSLPKSHWFQSPVGFQNVETCAISGYPKGESCPESKFIQIPKTLIKVEKCPFHQAYFVDHAQQYRVLSSCYPMNEALQKVFFNLPAVEELYFEKGHPWYQKLPPFKEGCEVLDEKVMEFMYPRNFTSIYLPKNHLGEIQPMVVKISHKDPKALLTWTLDGEFLGQTEEKNELPIETHYGTHLLVITDQKGNSIKKSFQIRSR